MTGFYVGYKFSGGVIFNATEYCLWAMMHHTQLPAYCIACVYNQIFLVMLSLSRDVFLSIVDLAAGTGVALDCVRRHWFKQLHGRRGHFVLRLDSEATATTIGGVTTCPLLRPDFLHPCKILYVHLIGAADTWRHRFSQGCYLLASTFDQLLCGNPNLQTLHIEFVNLWCGYHLFIAIANLLGLSSSSSVSSLHSLVLVHPDCSCFHDDNDDGDDSDDDNDGMMVLSIDCRLHWLSSTFARLLPSMRNVSIRFSDPSYILYYCERFAFAFHRPQRNCDVRLFCDNILSHADQLLWACYHNKLYSLYPLLSNLDFENVVRGGLCVAAYYGHDAIVCDFLGLFWPTCHGQPRIGCYGM